MRSGTGNDDDVDSSHLVTWGSSFCIYKLTVSGRSSMSSESVKLVTYVNSVERSSGQTFLRQATCTMRTIMIISLSLSVCLSLSTYLHQSCEIALRYVQSRQPHDQRFTREGPILVLHGAILNLGARRLISD